MADEAARRRELRRQKILANSETRLRRILNNDEISPAKEEVCPPVVQAQPEQPPVSLIANVDSADANSPHVTANGASKISVAKSNGNGGVQLTSGKATTVRAASFDSIPANPASVECQPLNHYNPLAGLDFSDIPAEELPLFGSEAFGTGDLLGMGRMPMGNNFGSSTAKFDQSPLAQLISSLASNDEAPLVTLANLAGRLGLPDADQSNAVSGRDDATDRRSSSEVARKRYQILWDPCHLHRIFFIWMLATLSRFVLPLLPEDYAMMFGPLYLMEILSMSLCLIYAVPLDRSRMSFALNLLLLVGASPKSVRLGHIFTACFELLFRDMSTYAFSFFVTHALCQQTQLLSIVT